MCGIAGLIDPALPAEALGTAIDAMTDAQVHRGPDARGTWIADGLALGHRRLSIIDLDSGDQPMAGPGGAVIVFNGEIYNFVELRQELEARGRVFRTRSDTEVLLAAWEAFGPGCVDRLIGMFAFAIWDPARREVFLARDRFGKKPLHYFHDGRRFAFASEIKGLLELDALRQAPDIDTEALADYLSLGYVLTPKTFFRSVRRLPGGHRAVFSAEEGTLRIEEYWSPRDAVLDERIAYGPKAVEGFHEHLHDAVRLRLRTDVPLSVQLSGGLDSSSVLAELREETDAITAYTVAFREKSFDETSFAAQVAEHLETPLVNPVMDPETAAPVERLVHHLDEPFADTSILPTYLLNLTTSRDVKVALSGDGADELMAGYPTYKADRYYKAYSKIPGPLQGLMTGAVRHLVRPSYGKVSWDYKLRQFLGSRGMTPERAHYWWRVVFPEADKARILSPDVLRDLDGYDPFDTFQRHFDAVKGADALDRALYVDLRTWLQDDILVKVDRMSMAHGVEVRSPFLDHRLASYALRLAPEGKMGAGQQKRVLRDCMAGRLPDVVFSRAKRGFNAPTRHLWATDFVPETARELFTGKFSLDPGAEDVTFKAFTLRILSEWLGLYDAWRRTGRWGGN